MTNRHSVARLFAVVLIVASAPVNGGGWLDNAFKLTNTPSPIPGQVLADIVAERWPESCTTLLYRLNTTIDPILDPLGNPTITLAEVRPAVVAAMAAWTDVPTSYIDFRLTGTTDNQNPSGGFDFVNEVTFRNAGEFGTGLIAISIDSYALIDIELVDGEDLDGDGDVDVTPHATTCRDLDGDGDIEIPPGPYPAGTIVENDVIFFPENFRLVNWDIDPGSPLVIDRFDFQGVMTHELGHSHGLSHSITFDTDSRDGTGATMTPGGPTTDGIASARTLHSDDIAWSSYTYPEGTAKSGAAALRGRDVAFSQRYSVISGEVKTPQGVPLLGAQPYAITLDGEIVSSAISGTSRVSFDPETLFAFILPPELGIVNGKYVIPVPKGVYRIGIESADGLPIRSGRQTTSEFLGGLYGQLGFPEEFWSWPFEGSVEPHSGAATPLPALKSISGVDFVTNAANQVIDPQISGGADLVIAPPGLILAVRIPNENLLALDAGRGLFVQQGLFGLSSLFEEEVTRLKRAIITTGRVRADGTLELDLDRPLVEERSFQNQTAELTPLHVKGSLLLGEYVRHVLPRTGKDLYVVAEFPDEEHPSFPGQGIASVMSIVQFTVPGEAVGNTFFSQDGGVTFVNPTHFDAFLGLTVTPR